ncbi:trigger factor, partial [bacterium]|nr:trigger factor [bacterium]
MKVDKKDLEKKQIELKIEVSLEEIKPHLDKAATKLAKKSNIPGFRPGKAPYDLVKAKVGEMTIWQEAMNDIINESFYKAITDEKLETIGQPDIKVEKMAPGNPVVYTAVVSLLPDVTLGEWDKTEVKKKEVKADDEDLKKTLEQLTNMRVEEKIVERVANNGDKVEVDFEVSIDKVVIEGGKSTKHPLVLGQGQMIPGFEEKIVGAKAGDDLKFDLKFPDKYMQENLAGKLANFKVRVVAIYERIVPEINDDFAKGIGFETKEALDKQLKENIVKEKEQKEQQRVEKEAIDAVVNAAKIEDLPETLIKSEVKKMIHELQHSIQQQGMDLAGYLKSIKKSPEDLDKDFRPQAIERLKAALVLRKLVEEEKIVIDEKDIDEEIKKQEMTHQGNEQALKDIKTPNYRQYLGNALTNRKVIE